MKILTKIYQQNFEFWTESIEICISEHGTFSSDSVKNKVIATMKGGFYFTMGCNKQVKEQNQKIKKQVSIISVQTYNKANFLGRNYRTEAMLTPNNQAKSFNESICDSNQEGVPYGICNKLIRMTTVLRLNDKFLVYPPDNRIEVY